MLIGGMNGTFLPALSNSRIAANRIRSRTQDDTDNHIAAIAIYFMHYNFCRVHQTLRVTPAMEAGLSNHVWSMEELCELLPKQEPSTKQIDNALFRKALGDVA